MTLACVINRTFPRVVGRIPNRRVWRVDCRRMQTRAAFNQTQSGSGVAEESSYEDLIAGRGAAAKDFTLRRTLADDNRVDDDLVGRAGNVAADQCDSVTCGEFEEAVVETVEEPGVPNILRNTKRQQRPTRTRAHRRNVGKR